MRGYVDSRVENNVEDRVARRVWEQTRRVPRDWIESNTGDIILLWDPLDSEVFRRAASEIMK